eukprot:CAMPEP_0168314274 /NCGR_PEP_ID=MMETSP0210-20121227/7022_1 /TAXON_ID=40633 /ORGANISM="Condylostoma magnum, Strain COL2" /LENGTH=41 /DNA_ID= /DNA_START= /DNA_END= /DNA_ORIENTATION=
MTVKTNVISTIYYAVALFGTKPPRLNDIMTNKTPLYSSTET